MNRSGRKKLCERFGFAEMNLDSEIPESVQNFPHRMGRRYEMWDPYSVPESEKNKGSEI